MTPPRSAKCSHQKSDDLQKQYNLLSIIFLMVKNVLIDHLGSEQVGKATLTKNILKERKKTTCMHFAYMSSQMPIIAYCHFDWVRLMPSLTPRDAGLILLPWTYGFMWCHSRGTKVSLNSRLHYLASLLCCCWIFLDFVRCVAYLKRYWLIEIRQAFGNALFQHTESNPSSHFIASLIISSMLWRFGCQITWMISVYYTSPL